MKKFLLFVLIPLMVIVGSSFSGSVQAQMSTIEIGDGTNSGNIMPFTTRYNYSYGQMVYTHHEIGEACYIGALVFDKGTDASVNFDELTIWMANVADSTFGSTSWVAADALKQVFHATNYEISGDAGDFFIPLDSAFHYDGTNHLAIVISKKDDQHELNLKFNYNIDHANSCLYRGRDSDPSFANHPGFAYGNMLGLRPNIKLVTNTTNDFCLPVPRIGVTSVTENTVTINWDKGVGANSFEVAIMDTMAMGSTDLNIAVLLPATGESYTFIGLNPNTDYLAGVRRVDNGVYSEWNTVKMKTTVIPASLPMSCDFENAAADEGWAIDNGVMVNRWVIDTAAHCGETSDYGLYVSGDSVNSFMYDRSSASTVYTKCLLRFETTGDFNVEYDWMCNGDSYYDYLRVFLVPAYMGDVITAGASLPLGVTSSSLPEGMVALDGGSRLNGVTEWQHYRGVVNIETVGNYYVVFMWRNYGNHGSGAPAAIDNVSVAQASCPGVDSVTVEDITVTSAMINGYSQAGNTFTMYLKESTVSVYDTFDITTPYTISTLKAGTYYEGMLRTDCGGDDVSLSVTEFEFGTNCADITLPWDFGAECSFVDQASGHGKYPYCWDAINGDNNTDCWTNGVGDRAHSGENAIFFDGSYSRIATHDDWLFTPTMTFTGNEEMSFWVKTTSSYSTSTYHGHFALYASTADATSINDTAHYTMLNITGADVVDNVVDIQGDTWKLVTIQLPNTLVGAHHLAFVVKGFKSFDFCLDDINLYTMSSCATPADVQVKSLGATEAQLVWSGDAASYMVYYGEPDFAEGSSMSISITDTTVTLIDLEAQHEYEFYIVATCSDGVQSNHSYPMTFTTACNPIATEALPYMENFDGLTLDYSDCIYMGTNNNIEYPTVTETANRNGNKGLHFMGKSNIYSYMALPAFAEDFANLTLTCNVLRTSTTEFNSDLTVGLMSNPNDISTYTPIDTLKVTTTGEWCGYQIVLTDYVATYGKYLAFVMPANGHGDAYAYLDNINISLNGTCNPPSDIMISNVTANTVDVSWTDEEGTSWIVYYGAPGFDGDTVLNKITTTTPSATISDLNQNTEYEVYVTTLCDDASESIASLRSGFRTTCSAIEDLPYTEDFESYANGSTEPIDPCWVKNVIGGSTPYPYPASSAAINGNLGLYFKAYENATSHYKSYAALPLFSEPINNLRLRFNMKNKKGYSSSSTVYASKVAVGLMSNPNDLSTFDTVQVIDMSDEPTRTVALQEVTFAGYEGSNSYIALLAVDVERGEKRTSDNAFYIDDIEVAILPNCQRPSDLVASNVTSTTIDLSWIGGANAYKVKYATHEDMSDGIELNSTDTTLQLTGLNPYTYYYINVCGVCDDITSEWLMNPIVVRTAMDCGEGYRNFVDTIGDGESASTNYVLNGSTSTLEGTNWIIYGKEELAEMGLLSVNNIIKSISLETGTADVEIGFRVYMAESDVDEFHSEFLDTMALSAMTMVYDDTMQFHSDSWNEIVLETPFTYSDTTNLMVAFERVVPIDSRAEFIYHRCGKKRTAYVTKSTYSSYDYVQSNRGNMIFNICGDVPSCVRPMNVEMVDITSSSVTISWTGTADNYQVVYDTMMFNPNTTGTPMLVSGNSTVVNGLQTNESYYIYVRSVCGEEYSLWSAPIKVTIPCDAVSVPYAENFDSYFAASSAVDGQSIDPCWVKGTNYPSTEYPYLQAGESASTPNSMLFYRNNTCYSYVALPLFDQPINTLMVAFKLYSESASAATMRVGVMSDPHDVNTFQTVAYAKPSDLNVWEPFEVKMNNYNGNGKFIALMVSDSASSAKIRLDDVEVFEIPTCDSPKNVSVSSITTNSAVVTWTYEGTAPAGGYEIEYGLQGFDFGEGTRISATTNTVTLSNLSVGTGYDVYVRARCSNTDESRWSFNASFYTNCGAIALPVTYDFENVVPGSATSIPHCFVRYNDATSSYYKKYPYVDDSRDDAHSGMNYIYWNIGSYSTNPEKSAMIFPEIDTVNYPMSENEMILWGKCGANGGKILVGLMSDSANINTFTVVDSIELTEDYAEYVVSFENYTGVGVYPTLMVERSSASVYVYVDDVTIEEIPSCPRVYDLNAIAATATTATLGWTDTIGSTQWILDYHTEGATAQSVTANANPFTLTGLTANTKYYFNVRPICASGDTSAALLHEAIFWTSQVPAMVPYTYDFEDGAEWNNWQTNSNNSVAWYRGTAIAGQGANAMYISADNGETYGSEWDKVVNAVVYRDIDFGTDTSSFTMTFKATMGGTLNHEFDGIAVLMVNPTDEVTASHIKQTSPWGTVEDIAVATIRLDTTWNTYSVYFERVAGVQRVAFYWYNQSMYQSSVYIDKPGAIDDISIVEQTCVRPYNLNVSNVEATTATLNWNGTASEYEVSYREIDDMEDLSVRQIVSANSIEINGLSSSTDYLFKVRAVCTDGDTSDWSNAKLFSTICARYVAIDTLREDFTDITPAPYSINGMLPDCWEGYTDGTNGVLPHVVGSGLYWYAHDTNSLVMTSSPLSTWGNTSVVRLPYTEEPIHTLTLNYWLCTESDAFGILEVGYLTGTNLGTDFVAVKTIQASSETVNDGTGEQSDSIGLYDTVRFENAPDNALAVAFRWFVDDGSTYSACIDDIVLSAEITCAAPEITDTVVDHQSATITWNGNAANYQLIYKEVSAADWSDTIVTTNTTYTITDLLPETSYKYMLRAMCGAEDGNSVWVEGSFTTTEIPCYTPTNLAASSISYESVSLSWESEGVATTWVVNVFNTNENILDTVETRSLVINNLYAGTEYQVSVKSLCAEDKSSEWSDTIVFTTTACLMVSDVVVSDITTNSAVVTWNSAEAVKWEINYGIDIAQGEGEFREVTERTYAMTGLESETPYDVYVRMYCTENTYGQWSDKVTFITKEETEGIDGVSSDFEFVIYPNPTSGVTTVSLNGVEGKVNISVVDMNGRVIFREAMECGSDCEKRLDIARLAQGTYFVRVLGNNVNSVRKLIVR